MKSTSIILILVLSACAAPSPYMQYASQQDINFCRYEASKVQIGQFASYGAVGQGIEIGMARNEAFNNCLAYRVNR